MKNTKAKIICVLILVLVIAGLFGVRFYQKWSHGKMLETVQTHAEAAGLNSVLIEVGESNKHSLYIMCSNFEKMEWDSLFAMHEDLMNIKGVKSITYVKRVNNGRHYVIHTDDNMIESYNSDGHIDYYGSWDNYKKDTYISTEAIIEDLEEMKNGSGDTSTANNSSNSSAKETDAKICAVKAVKDQLKSPSTADFCKYTEMTATNLGGDKWKITGWVDAQNSFGATIRENWTVTLTLTSSGFKDATVTFN